MLFELVIPRLFDEIAPWRLLTLTVAIWEALMLPLIDDAFTAAICAACTCPLRAEAFTLVICDAVIPPLMLLAEIWPVI